MIACIISAFSMQISHIFASVQNLNETIKMQRFFGLLLISMVVIGTGVLLIMQRKVFNSVSTEGLSYEMNRYFL